MSVPLRSITSHRPFGWRYTLLSRILFFPPCRIYRGFYFCFRGPNVREPVQWAAYRPALASGAHRPDDVMLDFAEQRPAHLNAHAVDPYRPHISDLTVWLDLQPAELPHKHPP